MEKKHRFFIYERREMAILILLGLLVALFAFTLGVHLGKSVGTREFVGEVKDLKPTETQKDDLPNRLELREQMSGTEKAAEEDLDKSLHDEVTRTGIRLNVPRQVDLPGKPASKNAGATTDAVGVRRKQSVPVPGHGDDFKETAARALKELANKEKFPALERPHPTGVFTIQVGSYPSVDLAKKQIASLEGKGLEPFSRKANIKRKGEWYRVYVGGFSSRSEADKRGKHYKESGVIRSFLISKMPGQ